MILPSIQTDRSDPRSRPAWARVAVALVIAAVALALPGACRQPLSTTERLVDEIHRAGISPLPPKPIVPSDGALPTWVVVEPANDFKARLVAVGASGPWREVATAAAVAEARAVVRLGRLVDELVVLARTALDRLRGVSTSTTIVPLRPGRFGLAVEHVGGLPVLRGAARDLVHPARFTLPAVVAAIEGEPADWAITLRREDGRLFAFCRMEISRERTQDILETALAAILARDAGRQASQTERNQIRAAVHAAWEARIGLQPATFEPFGRPVREPAFPAEAERGEGHRPLAAHTRSNAYSTAANSRTRRAP